jgi:uncharacterized protein (TIGR02145 family)
VFPTPDLTTFPLNSSQCSNVATGITLTSHVTGTNFSWTCTTSGATMSGYSAGIGTFINQTILNPGYTVGVVTYHIIPNANGCPGPETDYLVTVNPLPATSFTLCNDPVTTINSAPITLRGGVPVGGIFSGPGVANGVFTPWVAGAGNHIITYTYTNTYSCSKSATQTITVQPTAPFTCGQTLTDIRDSKTYPTVQIGSQCWMAANLNYGTLIPGTQAQRDNCIVEKYCYNNTQSGCASGALYQWDEMMYYETAAGAHGLCPPGWHIPTMAEWNTLFGQFTPGIALAGAALKSTGNSGFDALVSGWGSFNKTWNHGGFATMMWSSTSYGASKAWAHGMNTPDAGVSTYPGFRSNAFAVRCIR